MISVYDSMPCVVEMYRCCLGKLSSVDEMDNCFNDQVNPTVEEMRNISVDPARCDNRCYALLYTAIVFPSVCSRVVGWLSRVCCVAPIIGSDHNRHPA